ncbi:hypothetical protein CA3LBN_000399 [Candidozyma haemuli]|uniref:Lon protease homolog 2, peroxisomal n=2 Tax=Candidozyma TaxID=3303203 RepID=A0ABX8HZG6_9ASCO|nr:hypothetical protein CA3LBN_000399 [[Candida] haemuloni]
MPDTPGFASLNTTPFPHKATTKPPPNQNFYMTKFKNSTTVKDGLVSQQVVLTNYTLDSSLVLLPGIIYNVSFSRFKAAALLSRFRDKVDSVPLVKSLLSEYDFDSAASESSAITQDAFDGIQHFYNMEQQTKTKGVPEVHNIQPSSEFDWLVLAVSPNLSKIPNPKSRSGSAADSSETATIVRIVGIVDDTTNVKLTLQALQRATKVPGFKPKKPTEALLKVHWNDKLDNPASHLQTLKSSTHILFNAIDRFVTEYRQAMQNAGKNQDKKSDLLTLNPLANALFLQLAGSKDFSKAYQSLQKIVNSLTTAEKSNPRNLSRIVDLTAAIIPFPNHEKLKMLGTTELKDRVVEINVMISKMSEVFGALKENNKMVNHWFYNEASNIQRANMVANQLKSIRVVLEGLTQKGNSNNANNNANQRALVRKNGAGPISSRGSASNPESVGDDDEGDDDDDIRAIANFIKNRLPEITSLSEDSKRLITKDFKRIKSSPPGNADFHVIRNYLEIVMDMPWDKFVSKFKSNKDINIVEAKRQLDEDHYGLDHVKKRLTQYLVVLKLLGINADKEYERLGIKEAQREKELQAQRENRKFTRESNNGEAIIIPNSDETRRSKEQADSRIKKSKDMTSAKKEREAKELLASKNNRSPIIMLAGPPGVGKTSLAKSIAGTLGRKFQRVSLGGVRDESEIRGHRRTYVGAMPGTIVQALRKAKSMNPVILLDEIDKVVGGASGGAKFSGDPAAALLEVLDPEQNNNFMDHYLGFPIDLSQVIFICTANEPYNLSRPLLDRLEMIDIGAYDYSEKLVIGQKYLLSRQTKRNGFPDENLVSIDDDVMKKIILDYTREAGVRNLERQLGTVCRYKAVEFADSLNDSKLQYNPRVEEYDLSKYLGMPIPNLNNEIVEVPIQSAKYGVVNGLSYNTDGSGSVLIFESIGFNNEKGGTSLNMTGRLGEVLMESAKIGMTFIKNTLYKGLWNIDNAKEMLEKLNNLEIHMHVPSGAVQKDGPSAGITMALSFLSLLLEKPVPSNIAMTGEITLRGLVLPIGGLKEKMLGAHLTGQIQKIIVPRENRRDIIEEYVQKINDSSKMNELLRDNQEVNFKNSTPEDYFYDKYGVRVVYAKEFWDVIKHVWGEELLVKVEEARMAEYHL